MRTLPAALFTASATLLSGSGLLAQNFVANGNFDSNINGWEIQSANATFALDAALGSPAPGSVRITNNSPGASIAVGMAQCLGAITPAKHYNYGGRLFFPSGQARTGRLLIGLRFFSSPGCTGVDVGDQPRITTTIFDTWDLRSENDLAPPAGAVSVMFLAFPSKVEAGGSLVGNFDSLFFGETDHLFPPCVADAITLCLNNGRFSVTATWQTAQGDSGPGFAQPLTGDTGSFWFFSANNLEGIFKLVTGCPLNNHFWFFGGGLTNVKVTLRVADTETGVVNIYQNPLNTPFAPIQDTAAFPCAGGQLLRDPAS